MSSLCILLISLRILDGGYDDDHSIYHYAINFSFNHSDSFHCNFLLSIVLFFITKYIVFEWSYTVLYSPYCYNKYLNIVCHPIMHFVCCVYLDGGYDNQHSIYHYANNLGIHYYSDSVYCKFDSLFIDFF